MLDKSNLLGTGGYRAHAETLQPWILGTLAPTAEGGPLIPLIPLNPPTFKGHVRRIPCHPLWASFPPLGPMPQ